jgi:hypothetical protein
MAYNRADIVEDMLDGKSKKAIMYSRHSRDFYISSVNDDDIFELPIGIISGFVHEIAISVDSTSSWGFQMFTEEVDKDAKLEWAKYLVAHELSISEQYYKLNSTIFIDHVDIHDKLYMRFVGDATVANVRLVVSKAR